MDNPVMKRLLLSLLLLAVGTAAAVGTYSLTRQVIYKSHIQGVSMNPTLKEDDLCLGFRIKNPEKNLKRGDVVSLIPPVDDSAYVKRIIGLPGETVILANGHVYINNAAEPLKESYLTEEWTNNTGPYYFEVPEGHYLVLGDNRNESFDSRNWSDPYVAQEAIEAKTYAVLWPLHHIRLL